MRKTPGSVECTMVLNGALRYPGTGRSSPKPSGRICYAIRSRVARFVSTASHRREVWLAWIIIWNEAIWKATRLTISLLERAEGSHLRRVLRKGSTWKYAALSIGASSLLYIAIA